MLDEPEQGVRRLRDVSDLRQGRGHRPTSRSNLVQTPYYVVINQQLSNLDEEMSRYCGQIFPKKLTRLTRTGQCHASFVTTGVV